MTVQIVGKETGKARPVVRAKITAVPFGQSGIGGETAKHFPLIDGYSLDGIAAPPAAETPQEQTPQEQEPPREQEEVSKPKSEQTAREQPQVLSEGLLRYKKWWFTREVEIAVGGKLVRGTPIFAHENTLHVVGQEHSYFIPLKKIDYIRTPDGLNACRELEEQ